MAPPVTPINSLKPILQKVCVSTDALSVFFFTVYGFTHEFLLVEYPHALISEVDRRKMGLMLT